MDMEFVMGSGGGSGDEQQESSSSRRGKKYHRHTVQQIQILEAFFKECPHPDENQRRQLSRELGLETKQIKFWFQNKRTQTKAQNEKADNTVLRAENERIQCENLAIKEALKNVICPACGGPPFGEEERQCSLEKLQSENAQLKDEHEKVSNLLAKYIGKPVSQIELFSRPQLNLSPGSAINQAGSLDMDLASSPANVDSSYNQFRGIPDMEKAIMAEAAASAMSELIRLFRVDDHIWMKAPSDGRYVLHRDTYDKLFPRPSHFKNTTAGVESSKDSTIVTMSTMQLVSMMLDQDKWVDLFPTIVAKAKTIEVLEAGTGNGDGFLQLMYEELHILSPLVAPREFCFLRYCQQIEMGTWIIVDVSYDCSRDITSFSRTWKLPSGLMIQDVSDGCSKVTWIEHVQVDDKTQTHRLYRDLVCSNVAYGAERWVVTLRRMCERFTCSMLENAPSSEFVGVVISSEGRRNILKLAHRMVKNFSGTLSMAGKLDFPQLSEVNNSGVRVAVRRNTEYGQPGGMIVSAATSLWLPLPPHSVFNFFIDQKTRSRWDVLSNGHAVHEIGHISTGNHPGNCVSVIRPFIPNENNMLMLQESCIDPLGSMVVYAPLDIPAFHVVTNGEDPQNIPILPSGFIISGDGRPQTRLTRSSNSPDNSRACGSLLTVAFQILVSSPSSNKQLNMESVATVNTLISSTVQKIKVALNCSGLD